jgi:heat shock protein HslJ
MHISKPRRALSVLSLALLVAVSACGDDDEARPVSASDLDGKTFLATETEGHTIVEGSEITIAFTAGNITVGTGCNTLTGSYSIDEDTLTTGELAATLIACEEDLTAQQDWINGLLTSDPTVELRGDQLVLSSGDDSITSVEA